MLRNGTSVPPAPALGGVDRRGEGDEDHAPVEYRMPLSEHGVFVRYSRYRHFVMGCGLAAFDLEKRLAGAKTRRKIGRSIGE